MIVIFEGMDNCLKDTSINLLRNFLSAETHVIKCSSPPSNIIEKENYQKNHFSNMFLLVESALLGGVKNIILNRSHLGEYVYSQIYRNYNGTWIFELEQNFLQRQKKHLEIILILLYDSNNERLKFREDGKSLSKGENSKLDSERDLFLEAYEKSYIPNKIKFDLSELSNVDGVIDVSIIINEILKIDSISKNAK